MLGYLQTFIAQFDYSALLDAVTRVLAIILCLTVHETCHGLAALAMGDPTAKSMKRLSFNPLHHVDWLGLLSMFLCGFGWAKPVPVDMRYFKRPRLGMAVTALAGPVSNFLLALLAIFAAVEMSWVWVGDISLWMYNFLLELAVLSIGLGLFNLLPIPPLDGSKVLISILPEKWYRFVLRYERYGMLLLMLIVWLDLGSSYLSTAIVSVFYWIADIAIWMSDAVDLIRDPLYRFVELFI